MSDVNHVFVRDVTAPVPIRLSVEMNRGGIIAHIGSETDERVGEIDDLRVMRAIYLISPMIEGMQERGDLIADALLHLPLEPDFAIERSILSALAQLQTAVLPTFRAGKAA